MKRRILAGLLSLCMLAGLMPGTAWAETPQTAEHTHNEDGWVCTEQAAEPTLVCTQEEHTHTSDCYDADGALVCTLEEHTHTDDCWQQGESSWTCTAPAEGEQDGKVETPGDQQNGGSGQTPQAPDNTENPNTPEENPSKAPAGPQVTDNGEAPDESESEPQSPDNGEQPLSETRDTGAALADYEAHDGTTRGTNVTLNEAADILNEHGGGIITVTKGGTVKVNAATGVTIDSQIQVIANTPVVLSVESDVQYGNMFVIKRSTEEEPNTLTLGGEGMEAGLLTLDLSTAAQGNKCGFVSASDYTGDKSVLYIKDGVVLTGASDTGVSPDYSIGDFTVVMSGGEIVDNHTPYAIIQASHFIMTGGRIANNSITNTFRNLIFSTGDFDIRGNAVIEDCKGGESVVYNPVGERCYIRGNAKIQNCTGQSVGAVLGGREGDDGFELIVDENAKILNCQQINSDETVRDLRAGAIVVQQGSLTLQGNAEISGCTGYVGAIGINYTNFTMKGNAKITENEGRLCGGVGMTRSQVKIEGDSVISNNDGGRAGGGILALSLPSNFPTTLSISGGHITGNEAPQGAGICVAGKKLVSELLPLPPEYGDPQPCQLELSTGAEITGNTATEQGGGIWVGWEVSPKISGAINVTGNTLKKNGTANDIYLDRDPDAPEDPVVPEWPEESEEPVEPGNEPSFEAFLEFVHTLAAQTAKDELEAATDSEVVQIAQDLGYLQQDVTVDGLSPEKMASLRDWLEEQLIIEQSFNLISSDNIIAQYKNTYNAKPSLDVFKQTTKVVYSDHMVFSAKASFIGWTFDPANEKVVEAAYELGLTVDVDNGRYTGTEEQFWQAYKAYVVEYQFGEVTDEEWQAAYDNASGGKEEPVKVRDGRLAVTAPLTGSQIGVFVAGARSGRVFAYGNEYTLTPEDLDVFTVENPGYIGAGTVANTLVLKRPAVEIAPANMIIYMGGEKGYDGAVVNTDTGVIEASTSLPVLGFTVTLPNGVEADNLKLQYKNGDTVRQWTLKPYDGNESHNVYRIEPVPGSETKNVRMVFTNSRGETITEDKFDVSKNLNQTLTVKVYGEGIEEDKVSILCGDEEYPIKTMEGTITVRGTTSNVSYADVVENPDQNYKPADPEKPDQVIPGATVPTGTVFAINGGEVHVGADAQVALLFDAIIDSNAGTESKNYTELLEEKAEDILTPAGNATRHTEFRYLDLVDQKNGNAWVAAQDASGKPQTVTVYWPLPEGTTKDTKFTLLHFEGLNRGMTPQEITDKLTAPDYTPETISDLRVTDTHVIFETTGFSPFALVWDSTKPQTTTPGDDNNNNNNTTKNNVTVTDKADAPAPAAAAPSAAASGAAIPQTGDTLPVGLLGGVAAVAVAAFVVLLVLRKRKHDD